MPKACSVGVGDGDDTHRMTHTHPEGEGTRRHRSGQRLGNQRGEPEREQHLMGCVSSVVYRHLP